MLLKYRRPSLDESEEKLGRGRGDMEGQVRIFGFFVDLLNLPYSF